MVELNKIIINSTVTLNGDAGETELLFIFSKKIKRYPSLPFDYCDKYALEGSIVYILNGIRIFYFTDIYLYFIYIAYIKFIKQNSVKI